MKLPKLNQKGIAHILAPLMFIAIFAGIGGIVLLKSNAASVPVVGHFTPDENTYYYPTQKTAKLDVKIHNQSGIKVNRVEWFRMVKNGDNGEKERHQITIYHGTADGGYTHYSYPWDVSNATAGVYRWVAKIYSNKGVTYAINNKEQGYLDTYFVGKSIIIPSFLQRGSTVSVNGAATTPIDIRTPDGTNAPYLSRVDWFVDRIKVATSTNIYKTGNDCFVFCNGTYQIYRYNLPVEGLKKGSHTVTAILYDTSGFGAMAGNNGSPVTFFYSLKVTK